MIGDKLLIKEKHTFIAKKIFELIKDELTLIIGKNEKYTISVAGESGAGKSEMAHEIKKVLLNNNINTKILAQDDYFVFPPKTNHQMRKYNIKQVGKYEVKLDLIDANLFSFKNKSQHIYKPLVIYDKDQITHETLNLKDIDVLITEGTYVTSLNHINKKIFIDRTYFDTKQDRDKRAREKHDPFVEEVLSIEHSIISKAKKNADIIINNDFTKIISR